MSSLPEKQKKNLLLVFIQERWVYLDPKSIEPFIGTVKRKFKLFSKKFLNQYHFFVLTTNKDSCKENLSIAINQSDWERKRVGYLQENFSYIDLTKRCIILDTELLEKCLKRTEPFMEIAQLKHEKYIEFLLKIKNLSRMRNNKEQNELVAFFKLDENGEDLLRKLGL